MGKELLALLQLGGDAAPLAAIVGVERLVVAVGASAPAPGAVAVGAGEACIEADFLYLAGEVAAQEGGEVEVEGHVVVSD